MNFVQAVILSIIEGITEFLPISSTGHLILTSHILKIPQTDFVKTFEIVIQFGAILAVVVIYFKKLIKNKLIWKNILIAFLPTAIIGLLFYKIIKEYLLGDSLITVASLFIGGIIIILFEKFYKKTNKEPNNMSIKQSAIIGLFQSISMIPGVSRAAATIYGGLLTKLTKKQAVEFSFFLAVPTMFAASTLDIIKSKSLMTIDQAVLLCVGFVISFLTAFLVIKWLVKFIQRNNFTIFGIYRIILSVLFWLFIINN